MAIGNGIGKRGSGSISRVLSQADEQARLHGMVIHLGRRLPAASSDLPDDRRSGPLRGLPALARGGLAILFGLAPDGVCPATPVARDAVSSYLAFSPLPGNGLAAIPWSSLARTPQTGFPISGGIFSVALSIPFPGLAVSQHPVLRCPDFPPEASGEPSASSDHPTHFPRFREGFKLAK
jgi:hypothetical protein